VRVPVDLDTSIMRYSIRSRLRHSLARVAFGTHHFKKIRTFKGQNRLGHKLVAPPKKLTGSK